MGLVDLSAAAVRSSAIEGLIAAAEDMVVVVAADMTAECFERMKELAELACKKDSLRLAAVEMRFEEVVTAAFVD